MKHLSLILTIMALMMNVTSHGANSEIAAADSVIIIPTDSTATLGVSEFSSSADIARAENEYVIVGGDTISVVLPQRNFSRYDRGLYNFLFIPRGQWAFGITASYGEFNTEDVQLLSILKDVDFKGKTYQVNPTVSYFLRNNQSMGLRFSFTRSEADLNNLSMDFDEDLNFTIRDVTYYSQSYGVSVFYRNYVGLSSMKRFAIFNEIDLGVTSGSSRFKRLYNDEPRDTRTLSTSAALNFSPGLCVFIMDNVSFNVSFGVFGLKLTHEQQYTNDVRDGSRTTSGANFKFNLFNIKFGIGVHI